MDTVDLDVLMRGPVHEGFAEPMVDPGDYLSLPEPPPEPIEEMPAPVRPSDGQRDAVWVPGYWGVEGEADELCWVSGTWRYPPPESRWVPGYWARVGGEAMWVPGFWVDRNITRIQYLPAPPERRSWDPVGDPPGPDYFWVPGSWVWEGNDYVWHEGFWAQSHPDWVWVPARFIYTPRGYISVPGYWDYPPERRGLLFAPVRFARYQTLSRPYRPSVAISVRRALVHWFVRPQYRHYYFGDYYSDRYAQLGFSPWAAYTERVTYYDPLYVFYRNTGGDYLQNLISTRQRLVGTGGVTLPTTYRELRQSRATGAASAFASAAAYAESVDQLLTGDAGDAFADVDVQQVPEAELEQQREQILQLREFAQNRTQVEADAEARADARAEAGEDREAEADARAEARADADAEADGRMRERREPGERASEEPREQPREEAEEVREDQPRARGAAEERREDARERVEQRREQIGDRPGEAEEQREQAQEQAEEQREQAEERREEARERSDATEQPQPGQAERPREPSEPAADATADARRLPEDLPQDSGVQRRQPTDAATQPQDLRRLETRAAAGGDAPAEAGRAQPEAAEMRRSRRAFGEFDMSPYSRQRAERRQPAQPGETPQTDAAGRQAPRGLQPPENLDRRRMQRLQQLRGRGQGPQGQEPGQSQPRRGAPSAPDASTPDAQAPSPEPAPPAQTPAAAEPAGDTPPSPAPADGADEDE